MTHETFAYTMLCLIAAAFALGLLWPRKITITQAASIIGKLGNQSQLRTQAEKTRAIHDELRNSIGSSRDHATTAGDAAPRGRPA